MALSAVTYDYLRSQQARPARQRDRDDARRRRSDPLLGQG